MLSIPSTRVSLGGSEPNTCVAQHCLDRPIAKYDIGKNSDHTCFATLWHESGVLGHSSSLRPNWGSNCGPAPAPISGSYKAALKHGVELLRPDQASMFVCTQMYPLSGSAMALAGYSALAIEDSGDLAMEECPLYRTPLVGVTLLSTKSGVLFS